MTEPRRSTGRRIVGPLALGLASSGCLLAIGFSLLADPIATSIARERLAAQGIACDERFSVDVAWSIDLATLAPTRCTVERGDVESFELLDPVGVELAGLEARTIRGGRARVITRFDPPVVRTTGLGAVLDALSIPQRLGVLVAASSRLAATDIPAIEIGAIEIGHAERPSAALAGVHVVGRTATEPLTLRIDRVDLPPIDGPIGARAALVVAPLTGEATPARVRLEGDLSLDAALPILGGTMQRDVHVVVTGEGLDGPSPTFDVHL